jgi:hypothetical protein
MEIENIDLDKLSKLYPQLDALTPDEKWKAIDYLVKSLIADTNKASSIVGTNDVKISTEVLQKSEELVETIDKPQVPNKKESNEHREKLTAEDCNVYIHWNPNWHKIVWEDKRNRHYLYNDPLLKNGSFDRYYAGGSKDYNGKEIQILARDLWNQSIEYTITQPSDEGRSSRIWGYIWLTIILKNWYKIKDTWELPAQDVRKNYDWTSSVGEFMSDFMKYLIESCNLAGYDTPNHVKRKNVDEDSMRKAVFQIKNALIESINENENFKGWIIKQE